MTTIRANPGATVGLAALVALALTLPFLVLAGGLAAALGLGPEDAGIIAQQAPTLGQVLIGLVLPLFATWVTQQAALGRRVSAGQVWRATRGRLLAGVGAVVLTGLAYLLVIGPYIAAIVGYVVATSGDDTNLVIALGALALGTLAVLALMLFLWTRFAFVLPAVVVEGAGPITAIRRSWALTRGVGMWKVLGIRLLTMLLLGVVSSVLSCPLSILSIAAYSVGGPALGAVLGALSAALQVVLTSALVTPAASGVDALLYLDQRIRREGYDIDLIREASQAPDALAR